jgi:hypothetical protein
MFNFITVFVFVVMIAVTQFQQPTTENGKDFQAAIMQQL